MTPSNDRPVHKHPFESWIGTTLLVGVLASATFLAAGLIWRWIATGSPGFDYTLPRSNVFGFARGEGAAVLRGEVRPRLLVNLGLVILLLTPYARVLLSFFYFTFFQRNWKYSFFTGIVLAVLTYSLLLR